MKMKPGLTTLGVLWLACVVMSGVARPRIVGRTSDRSGSVTLEFMRLGRRLVARAERDEVHHAECEFEVTVKDDGFVFEGCWGSDKTMTYDPADREYPFKGRYDGTFLWLAPVEMTR
jgi:hypothetical protein